VSNYLEYTASIHRCNHRCFSYRNSTETEICLVCHRDGARPVSTGADRSFAKLRHYFFLSTDDRWQISRAFWGDPFFSLWFWFFCIWVLAIYLYPLKKEGDFVAPRCTVGLQREPLWNSFSYSFYSVILCVFFIVLLCAIFFIVPRWCSTV
jgi:hypothetical protein